MIGSGRSSARRSSRLDSDRVESHRAEPPVFPRARRVAQGVRAFLLGLLLLSGSGCASWVAVTMPGPASDDFVSVDMSRSEVEGLLGESPRSMFSQGGMTEARYEYSDGPPSWAKGRAILYIAADAFTLFLSELIFWPIELYAKDRIKRVAVAQYSTDNRLAAWSVRREANRETLVAQRSARYDEYVRASQAPVLVSVSPVAAVRPVSSRPPPRVAAPGDMHGAPVPAAPSVDALSLGRYHALVIGNDAYSGLPRLETARADARAIAEVLAHRYGFEVELLLDATRSGVLRSIADLRKRLGPNDNLLIYYAGHGIRDEGEDHGYWLPVDAERDDPTQWIANAHITRQLKAMSAKHVIVIADSCYAGSLTRGIAVPDRAPGYLLRLAQRRSRTAMTSGGIEPVADGGVGGNSVFAAALLDALRENDGVIEAGQLFARLRRRVAMNSDQTPQYAPIPKAGHDDGEFLFATSRAERPDDGAELEPRVPVEDRVSWAPASAQ